jgi:hypothetical protein
MPPSFVRTSILVLGLALGAGACRTSGSFLLFGGSEQPQAALVEGVAAAKEEAEAARADFSTAFQLYQRLTAPQAVELEGLSEDFADAVDDCAGHSEDLAERIETVRGESATLLEGWNEELAHFSSETLRKKSAALLQDTEARSQRVLQALERLQGRMSPVLLKLQDYALFFHHNLNARAIATLEDTYKDFDGEFRSLEGEFGRVTSEVDAFLANFAEPEPAESR